MILYSPNNMAKQWIFETLDQYYPESFRVLDLACGDTAPWTRYLQTHPHCSYQGFDYNKTSLKKAQKLLESLPHAKADYGDAQRLAQLEPVDVVTAFSALEHVVNLESFCKTAHQALKHGGIAFLNYDIGHFRSSNLKERAMIPVSQLLARLGIEGPYMKEVQDMQLLDLVKKLGFEVREIRKHNIASLKGEMKQKPDAVLQEWYQFETRLNQLLSPKDLHSMMLSTTLLLAKS